MDRIFISKLRCFGYHGVFEKERKYGQEFVIDISLLCDLKKPGETDRLDDTVDYSRIALRVKETVANSQYELIEALGQRLINEIFSISDKIEGVTLTVSKPNAPINADFENVGIEISRIREKGEISFE